MSGSSANPYEVTVQADSMRPTRSSKQNGFLIGFRNGALWSLLLVAPTAPMFYAEMTMHKRIKGRAANGGPLIVELSPAESANAWVGAITSTVLAITLPWAFTAGCVSHFRHLRENTVENQN